MFVCLFVCFTIDWCLILHRWEDYFTKNVFLTLFISIQSKDKMMRGSRRGCVRLRVRFSGQVLLTSVTNPYRLYSLCICIFLLVLHNFSFYPTLTIFNNVNNMSKLWRLIQTQWYFCFAETISQCNGNVSGDLQTCVLHWSTFLFCESGRV